MLMLSMLLYRMNSGNARDFYVIRIVKQIKYKAWGQISFFFIPMTDCKNFTRTTTLIISECGEFCGFDSNLGQAFSTSFLKNALNIYYY